MKTQTAVAFFLFFASLIEAQKNESGIYLTATDFVSHKISFQKQESKKYKFHIHENKNFVTVQLGDSSLHFSKDSIFGFVDKHNTSFRFYKGEMYKILNPNENILLYSREHLGGNKGAQTIIDYYFSKVAGSTIHRLTRHNLKLVFMEQTRFVELIDLYFSSDEELKDFDSESGLYKINALENIAQKK